MATTPKKNASAPGSGAPKKKRSFATAATTVLLIACVCGVIAAALVFSGSNDEATATATISTANAHVRPAATEEALQESASTAAPCKTKKCKAGGSEVCGTDGKTYLNECFFHNAQCNDTSLDKVKDWKGYNCPNKCKKKIACNEVGKFLCASDGNVYFGYCNLYVAQCLDPKIEEIKCDKSIFEGVFGN